MRRTWKRVRWRGRTYAGEALVEDLEDQVKEADETNGTGKAEGAVDDEEEALL